MIHRFPRHPAAQYVVDATKWLFHVFTETEPGYWPRGVSVTHELCMTMNRARRILGKEP